MVGVTGDGGHIGNVKIMYKPACNASIPTSLTA